MSFALCDRLLARLLYPEWTQAGDLGTYHAFSLHLAAAGARGAFPEHDDAWDERAQRNGTRLPLHMDICEVSVNVCLGTGTEAAPGLEGSRVAFLALNGEAKDAPGGAAELGRFVDPGGAGEDELWIGHTPGSAFMNLCQHRHGTENILSGRRDSLVLRGFTSSFRRAPAETFAERCLLSSASD